MRKGLKVLTDHEIDLVHAFLEERAQLLAQLLGAPRGHLEWCLRTAGLSLNAIAQKFEVSKSSIRDYSIERRRSGRRLG